MSGFSLYFGTCRLPGIFTAIFVPTVTFAKEEILDE